MAGYVSRIRRGGSSGEESQPKKVRSDRPGDKEFISFFWICNDCAEKLKKWKGEVSITIKLNP